MMPTKNPTSDHAALSDLIRNTRNTTDLYKLVTSAEFRAAASQLNEGEQEDLRQFFLIHRDVVKNKVKMEDLDNRLLHLTSVDFQHSDKFNNDFCVFKGTIIDEDRTFETITSAVKVYRWAVNNHKAINSPDGVNVTFIKVEHTEGRTIWEVKNAPKALNPMDEIPF